MNYEDIKKIIDDMGNAKIDELGIEFPDGTKINMKKNIEKTTEILPEYEKTEKVVKKVVEKSNNEEDYNIVKSPMVGTFYASSSPKEEPYVKVGDVVRKGQVLCIVEAMKLMNEIESDFDGEIVEICMKNEDVVQYGAPLFKLRKKD